MKAGIDYIGVGVGAIIISDEGKIFLTKRGAHAKNERSKWECPGGSVTFGETLTQALRREIFEEYGIEIAVGPLLDVVDHIIPDESQHWISPSYICRIVSGEPVIQEPGKCDAIGWFELKEAKAMTLSIVTIENLRSLQRQYPNGLRQHIISGEL